jgi:succinate dehydrogenase / fumarate reductase cytochrome b subunit
MGSVSIANRHFLLRRLHSLFGLLPVGAFVIFHLWENSQSRFGAEHYNQDVVGWLQGLNYLTLLEVFMIALPILFHALYGLVIVYTAKPEPIHYPFMHNRFYLLQRVSGVGVLLFLLIHVGWTRIWGIWEPAIKADMFGHMHSLLTNPLLLAVYVIGLLLAVFHLCYGLWSMGLSWGVTTTPEAQARSFWLMMGLALLLAAMGLQGIAGFLA